MKEEKVINIIKEEFVTKKDIIDLSKEELNELSNDGETFPLLFAIQNGEERHFIFTPEVLEKLDLNMTNKHGTTALMELAKYDRDKEVKILLEAGADIALKDEKGKTAKDYAIEFINSIAPEEESGILWVFNRWEKEYNNGINSKYTYFYFIMSVMKKEKIINLIKEKGSYEMFELKDNNYPKEELNELSNDGKTFPLLLAIQKGKSRHFVFTPEVLEKLDLNMTNKHGTTALMELAKRGMANEMAVLVKAGVDWTLKDEKGKTAHEYAYEYAHDFDVDTVQEGCEHTLEAFHILEELRDTKSKTELALSNGTNTEEYLD